LNIRVDFCPTLIFLMKDIWYNGYLINVNKGYSYIFPIKDSAYTKLYGLGLM
jgi:hypothetical protein